MAQCGNNNELARHHVPCDHLLQKAYSAKGKALKKVPSGVSSGSHCVVNSEFDNDDPVKWAEAIKAIDRKERKVRLKEAILLRQYYAETYQSEGQGNAAQL